MIGTIATDIAVNTVTVDVPSNVLVIWSARRVGVPDPGVLDFVLYRNNAVVAASNLSNTEYAIPTLARLDAGLAPGTYTYRLTGQSTSGEREIRDVQIIVIPFAR